MLLRLSAALRALCAVVLAQTATIPAPDDPVVYSSFFRLHNNAIAAMAQQSAGNSAVAETLVNNLTASWYVKATDYPTILAITQEVIAKNGANQSSVGNWQQVPSATLVVTSSTPLSVSCSGPIDPMDLGQQVSVTATPSGGTPPYIYSWSGSWGAWNPGNVQNATFTPTAPGTYTATVVVTESLSQHATNSCSVSRARTHTPLLGTMSLSQNASF